MHIASQQHQQMWVGVGYEYTFVSTQLLNQHCRITHVINLHMHIPLIPQGRVKREQIKEYSGIRKQRAIRSDVWDQLVFSNHQAPFRVWLSVSALSLFLLLVLWTKVNM